MAVICIQGYTTWPLDWQDHTSPKRYISYNKLTHWRIRLVRRSHRQSDRLRKKTIACHNGVGDINRIGMIRNEAAAKEIVSIEGQYDNRQGMRFTHYNQNCKTATTHKADCRWTQVNVSSQLDEAKISNCENTNRIQQPNKALWNNMLLTYSHISAAALEFSLIIVIHRPWRHTLGLKQYFPTSGSRWGGAICDKSRSLSICYNFVLDREIILNIQ